MGMETSINKLDIEHLETVLEFVSRIDILIFKISLYKAMSFSSY